MTLEVSISGSALSNLDRYQSELSGESVKHTAGRAVRRLLMTHLANLDGVRANPLGGKRTHYYADAARNVSYDVTDDGAEVKTHQLGLALHYYGGMVKPTGGRRFLTIPVDPAAYGHVAKDFDLDIAWGRSRDGRIRPIGLVTKGQWKYRTTKNRKTGASEVSSVSYAGSKWMFALVYSATINEDKSILPDPDTINMAALSAITDYVSSKMRAS